jgi:general secretion pathway protein F
MAPIFDYKAISPEGKNLKGLVEAESSKAARLKLKKQGMMVTEIIEKTALKPRSSGGLPFIGNRVGIQEISLMIRQLASLVKANIPLVEALNALVDQTENTKLKVVLAQVRQEVNEGSSLGKAVGAHPKIFDNIFVNMIEAGESSGTLSLVLLRLADLKEAQTRLRGKIITAATYPALMMLVAVTMMLGIFTFVIPKLAKVFESMNKPMPPITKFMISFSDLLVSYWYVFVIAGIVFAIFFKRWVSTTRGRESWDTFVLKTPIFGPLIRMVAMTRFASTMSTLLGSGVPILTAMAITRNLVSNVPIARAIANARENITEGQSITEPLRKSGEFPPMMIHMIAIGEKTGELPGMLTNVAETYEEQVNGKVEAMTSLLEPMMIIIMGLMVGGIVMSVFLPLMDLSNVNQR